MKLAKLAVTGFVYIVSCARIVDKGLNLPPTQGTTRDGAFFQGLYQYDYHKDQVATAASRAGFSALRLAVNVETASNVTALQTHKAYLDSVGGRGIICMFDTSITPGASWPRSGRVTEKLDQVAHAWRTVHSVFASYGDNVMYEIFNEPWGYKNDAVTYVHDMKEVIRLAELPHDRCILAGLYGSADVQSVARAGWPGYLAYHVYVFWLGEGQRTEKAFSQRIQQDLAGLSDRVFITEFGVGLDGLKANIDEDELKQDVVKYADGKAVTSDWHNEFPEKIDLRDVCAKYPKNKWCQKKTRGTALTQNPMLGADVAAQTGGAVETPKAPEAYQEDTMGFLRGIRHGLNALKKQGVGIRGLYHWHGWHNGDTWDFWDAANARSSRLIQMTMMDIAEDAPLPDDDAYMSEDFVRDEQSVHMMVVRQLDPKSSAACPAECSAQKCLAGNEAQIGGKHLTGGFCNHNCSQFYGAWRFCGVGEGYNGQGAISCGGCAHPAMCAGLPCWSELSLTQNHTIQLKSLGAKSQKKPSFLQKR